MTYFWSYKPALGGDRGGAPISLSVSSSRVHLKYDGTRWRTGGEVKGKLANECVASTLHTTSEHGVSRITTADAHTSAAISRLNWRPRRFKWTRPFRWKTKSVLCACVITFQTQSTNNQTTFRRFIQFGQAVSTTCCRAIVSSKSTQWRFSFTYGRNQFLPALSTFVLRFVWKSVYQLWRHADGWAQRSAHFCS